MTASKDTTSKAPAQWTILAPIIVSVLSMSLNVVQYLASRTDRARDLAEKQEEQTSAEAFFAFSDDHNLLQLYSPKGVRVPRSQSRLEVAETPVGQAIQAHVTDTATKPNALLRRGPVASFLVLHNVGKKSIQNIRAVSMNGLSEQELVNISLLSPEEYVMVPLDFMPPGNSGAYPEIPQKVTVRYQGGNDLTIMAGNNKVTWIDKHFQRALVRVQD